MLESLAKLSNIFDLIQNIMYPYIKEVKKIGPDVSQISLLLWNALKTDLVNAKLG